LPDAKGAQEASQIITLLERALREAGALALGKFRGTYKSWTKDKSSPVSEVDIAVDELLRERLGAHDPAYGWLSEETADDPARLDAQRVWIVDPIDGTRGFIAGFPDWSIVAALVEQGRPIAAGLYAPVTEQLYLAQAGQGTRINGRRSFASEGNDLDGMRAAGPKRRLDLLATLAPRLELIPKVHSLALRLARIAEGTLEVAFAGPNSRDWDLAAADLLVHEAGGRLTTLSGQRLTYNRAETAHPALVAAGEARHQRLLHLIRDRHKEFA
jgi:myo-inositol-1(or 4)-monophosphatase